MKINIDLTNNEIQSIDNDRQILADIINNGNCCKFLDDTGLSVIDLHGVYVRICKAIKNKERELSD